MPATDYAGSAAGGASAGGSGYPVRRVGSRVAEPGAEPKRGTRSMSSRQQHATRRNPKAPNRKGGGSAEQNLNDIAYATIKDDIISCVLQPGADVSEGMLVTRYELGKAPIRSALMRLRQEGLIISRGRQGNAVSPVTLRDVKEVFQLRLVLEVARSGSLRGRLTPSGYGN